MYFDNAVALHRQCRTATKDRDDYLAERLTEKLDWAVRQHVKEIGGDIIYDWLDVYLASFSVAVGYDQKSI